MLFDSDENGNVCLLQSDGGKSQWSDLLQLCRFHQKHCSHSHTTLWKRQIMCVLNSFPIFSTIFYWYSHTIIHKIATNPLAPLCERGYFNYTDEEKPRQVHENTALSWNHAVTTQSNMLIHKTQDRVTVLWLRWDKSKEDTQTAVSFIFTCRTQGSETGDPLDDL